MKKVLIVSDGCSVYHYHKPFAKFGGVTFDSEILWKAPEKVRLVVFTGGADVAPSLYGQAASRSTACSPKRDIFEQITFEKAHSLRLPLVGICRGAQFLNVMAGGTIIQHLDGHHVYHDMTTWDQRRIRVSSTHHQMILPPKSAKLLGWASERRSKYYYGEDINPLKEIPEKETEAFFWPNIRAVGMQFHPEAMYEESSGFKFAEEIVRRFL